MSFRNYRVWENSGGLAAWVAASVAIPMMAYAVPELAPYQGDPHTLHLWHLDEKAAPFADAVAGGLKLRGLLNGAAAGRPAAPGMGASVFFHHNASTEPGFHRTNGGILLSTPALDNGPGDNAPADFRYTGKDGAFTIEALARFDAPLSDGLGWAAVIVSMDGEGGHREFNWRVEKSGFLSFIPLTERNRGAGALAVIPISGPDAINTTDWFHLAVTYDGNEGAANSLKLYWTRLDGPRERANLIGQGLLQEDLSGISDFAIGNEAGAALASEPFVGRLDEVRISSVARDPTDFIFVPASDRKSPEMVASTLKREEPLRIDLARVLVNGAPAPSGDPLILPAGTHRLDFDFGAEPTVRQSRVSFRCRLGGLDDQWTESVRGMALTIEALDAEGGVVSWVSRPMIGASARWMTGIEDSKLAEWSEPLHIPGTGKMVRIRFSSGTDDTVGVGILDDLELLYRPGQGRTVSLLANSGFERGADTQSAHGVPAGWSRGGSAPTVACMVLLENNPALALVDGDQTGSGEWTVSLPLPPLPREGGTLVLRGREMFHVIGGNRQQATFANVPPGNYVFEVAAVAASGDRTTDYVRFPFTIRAPVTERPWFWALVAAVVVGSLGVGIVTMIRHRAHRKVSGLRLQNALARERSRIARDMHDDLGTRVTVIGMAAALAERDLALTPERAAAHLASLREKNREMVEAMEGLVWAVDPGFDTINHLGGHLAQLADHLFREPGVRCRLDIPLELPQVALGAEMRHHLAMATKEALHNALRHSGCTEVGLGMEFADGWIRITVRDNGTGFDSTTAGGGHGLTNIRGRMEEIGGTAEIESSPGNGATVRLVCRLSTNTRSGKP